MGDLVPESFIKHWHRRDPRASVTVPSYDVLGVLGHYFHEVPSGSYKGAEPGECREYHDLEARAASASVG